MTTPHVPGAMIAERYRLERLLGEGGMGSVWAATHLVTQKPVALKFLKSAHVTDAMVRRFMREARAVSAVRHPNVVEVHDVLEHDGHPVMVMDLLNGESLAARLAREAVLPLPEFARIMLPIVSAIGKAHAAGIVHRDLKPDNVFLDETPDAEPEPKVLDFGIAKFSAPEGAAAATAHLTSTGAVMGTPYYMAPEQVFGEKDLDHRADVWAIGVMSYECLSGRKPFDGDNVGQLFKAIVTGQLVPLEQAAPELPKDVTDAVSRLLQKDRSERASDLRELYATLKRYSSRDADSFGSAKSKAYVATHTPSADHAVGALSGTITLPLDKRRWAPLAIGALMVFGAIAAVAFIGLRSTPTPADEPPAEPVATPALTAPEPPKVAPAESIAVAPATAAPSARPDAGRATPKRAAIARKEPPSTPSATAAAAPTPAPTPTRAPGTIVEPPPF